MRPLRKESHSHFPYLLTVSLNTDIDNPPTVPTLHVLYIREQSEVPPSLTSPPEGEQLRLARGELLRWIADEALGGDQEAAEWVLFTIIARA